MDDDNEMVVASPELVRKITVLTRFLQRMFGDAYTLVLVRTEEGISVLTNHSCIHSPAVYDEMMEIAAQRIHDAEVTPCSPTMN